MTISTQMRDVLIEHLDNQPVAVLIPTDTTDGLEASRRAARLRTTTVLVSAGLLRRKKHHTVITEEGRAMLAKVLGDWADALARAGWNDDLGFHGRPGRRDVFVDRVVETDGAAQSHIQAT